jgi:hypothetical protein
MHEGYGFSEFLPLIIIQAHLKTVCSAIFHFIGYLLINISFEIVLNVSDVLT